MTDVSDSTMYLDPLGSSSLQTGDSSSSVTGTGTGQDSGDGELSELAALFEALLQAIENQKTSGQDQSGGGSTPDVTAPGSTPSASAPTDTTAAAAPAASSAAGDPTSAPLASGTIAETPVDKTTSASTTPADTTSTPASTSAASSGTPTQSDTATSTTSAGSGPNDTVITNTSTHDEKIGEFLNGGSTTTPSAEIDLKPGQTGDLRYENGQGGFDAEADSSGNYQPTASRLEFYADSNGVNNDDVSDIDGDNAAIAVNDGHGRSAGETKSIAADAPSDIVTKDSGGLPTIAGWYDGSTQSMQDGGAYMENQLGGTGSVYIHPDDDRNGAGENPMTMAQDSSQTYHATFGNS